MLIESTSVIKEVDHTVQDELVTVNGEKVSPIENIDERLIQLSIMSEGSHSKTMHIKRCYDEKEVHVLIDFNHNFIHPTLVKVSKVKLDNNEALSVE